ncbi:H-2 class II histocompatibility antigen, A-S beta chain-like [Hoplias malabaricus]|uniref:H-2 class II histocompatibility antigen, A-S beta chain-like n=1 Tax=Hoplias malabaricus TaxID=27720 RepID=UPI003461AD30
MLADKDLEMFLLLCLLLLVTADPVSAQTPINITVSVGSTAVLPCDLSRESSALSSSESPHVQWRISSGVVFETHPEKPHQGEGYEGRVDVPEDQLRNGDCCLFLNNVTTEDEGEYECYLLENQTDSSLPSKRVFQQRVNLVVKKSEINSSARRDSSTVPDVYVFVKKSQTESSGLNLTCLATGFYPKDLKMRLRRFTTSLPDHLLTSSGVRPNGDGTYQLRKSVDVQEEDTAGYDCSVEHSALQDPVIKPWDGTYSGSSGDNRWIIGGVVVGLLLLVSIVIGIIVCKRRKSKSPSQSPPAGGEGTPLSPVPPQPVVNGSCVRNKTDEDTEMVEEDQQEEE